MQGFLWSSLVFGTKDNSLIAWVLEGGDPEPGVAATSAGWSVPAQGLGLPEPLGAVCQIPLCLLPKSTRSEEVCLQKCQLLPACPSLPGTPGRVGWRVRDSSVP